MDEAKANVIKLMEDNADAAKARAEHLRLLAEYVVGSKDDLLRQAEVEDSSSKSYEHLARTMRKLWEL